MSDYLSKRGRPYLQGTNRYQRRIGTQTYNEPTEPQAGTRQELMQPRTRSEMTADMHRQNSMLMGIRNAETRRRNHEAQKTAAALLERLAWMDEFAASYRRPAEWERRGA